MAILMLLSMQFMVENALAYEIETHRDLSRAAANRSVLSDVNVLQRFGILKAITDTSQTFSNSLGDRESIEDLIRSGSRLEDKLPGLGGKETRVFHHFFNPANGKPLTITGLGELGYASPDWALEDKGELTSAHSGEQKFSYRDARKYFLQALTMPSKVDRDRNWGLTFQSLGHVIHHIQDMAQPQHVRNDPHCGSHCANAYPEAFFERWVDENRSSLSLDPASVGYDVSVNAYKSTFSRPRSFWHSQPALPIGLGTGLAEFAHINFVSSGTISNVNFEFPVIDKTQSRDFDIKHLMPGTTLSGTVKFFSSQVRDNFLGTTIENPIALSQSIFDPDLIKVDSTFPVYTLNRFNFQTTAGFLLPRAVAHSAGLINYFFRTDFDLVPDSFAGWHRIQNNTDEEMNGKFTAYTDHPSGQRFQGPHWMLSIPPRGQSERIQLPAAPGITVVFAGTHGLEGPVAGSVGAVGAQWTARCTVPTVPWDDGAGYTFSAANGGSFAAEFTTGVKRSDYPSGGMRLVTAGRVFDIPLLPDTAGLIIAWPHSAFSYPSLVSFRYRVDDFYDEGEFVQVIGLPSGLYDSETGAFIMPDGTLSYVAPLYLERQC